MADYFYNVTVDATGKTVKMETAPQRKIRVCSTEIMPVDFSLGDEAVIVDKIDVAICDGKGNWYREADKPVAGGQPWSALFNN